MNDTPIVHVIDDDAGMRKSLQMAFEGSSMEARVYESGDAFLAAFDPRIPGCVVTDLRMPEVSGIELLRRLREDGSEMPVIIISGHADVPSAVRGMQLGAIDLFEKPFELAALMAAVRRAVQKSVEKCAERAELALIKSRFKKLTDREMELLKLVVAGQSNKQIAVCMKISIKTVANHRANLMAKVGAMNGPDLARMSVIAGL